jgi:hypothetical protein
MCPPCIVFGSGLRRDTQQATRLHAVEAVLPAPLLKIIVDNSSMPAEGALSTIAPDEAKI